MDSAEPYTAVCVSDCEIFVFSKADLQMTDSHILGKMRDELPWCFHFRISSCRLKREYFNSRVVAGVHKITSTLVKAMSTPIPS
jgi:hypothetical protein